MAKRAYNEDDEGQESEEEPLQVATGEGSSKPANKPKPAPKKRKSAESGQKGNIGKNVSINTEGDSFVDLGNKRRATVRKFKGAVFIDLREYYGDDDDEKPGKKGIALNKAQWDILKENASTIDSLIQKLK